MITFLLIVIAVLLYIIASKFAPDELAQLVPIIFGALIIYFIFQYWQFILAIPFVAFYAIQAFTQTELFQSIMSLVGGVLILWAIYVGGNKVISDLKSKEGRIQWKKGATEVLKLSGKVILYSVIGVVGLVVFMFALIYLFIGWN